MRRLLVSVAMTAAMLSPAVALDLGGGGGDRSGVSASVDRDGVSARVGSTEANVGTGGTGSGVDVEVNGPADTKVKARILGRQGVADAKATSDLLDGIDARITALSKEELLKVCVDVGGGDACNSGSRSELLNLIQARLDALGPSSLANLCLSVGGTGCGRDSGGPAPIDPPNGGSGGDDLDDNEVAAFRMRCDDILDRPRRYDRQLVRLCQRIDEL